MPLGIGDPGRRSQRLDFDLLGDLYTVSASGGDARRLTSGPAFDSQPVYSPDGRRIAWLSDASGAESIWVADADGSEAQRVSPDDGDPVLVSPEWSADGKSIFVSQYRADLNAFELLRFDVARQQAKAWKYEHLVAAHRERGHWPYTGHC